MINYLPIALWLVCFFDALILLCLPTAEKIIFSTDGSAARYVVDLMCLAIGLIVLFTNGWQKLPSKLIGILLGFMLISHFHAPNITFDSLFMPKDHAIFDYKPMFEAILFFILFMGVYSMDISIRIRSLIRKSLVLIPTIYAGVAILQRFGLDQLYQLAGDVNHMSRNPEVGGFISQPVFCAALIAICIPFVIRYGYWWQVVLCVAGILATGNRSALIVVIICALYGSRNINWGKLVIGLYISYLVLGILLQFYPIIHHDFLSEERFVIWKEILQDFHHSSFPGISTSQILTGTGIGSFSVIFPFFHHNGYYQAHNEFLEAFRCLGIVGLGLLIAFVYRLPRLNKCLYTCLIASIVLALTNAIWHIPQLAFMTVFILGLSYNKTMGVNHVETSR